MGDKITGPSVYSEMVGKCAPPRAQAPACRHWIGSVRNRAWAHSARQQRQRNRAIANLSKTHRAFRICARFNERCYFLRTVFPAA